VAFSDGTRFGPYEVTGQIGAGGMGEVYRATDTNLKRDVAIKVLPTAFAADADRLARFRREAEVLASLNHPNIATIFGLENADGRTVIVMELVEGPTLADRIAQGPVPPDEALGIAHQIADALEAAHGRQIVHRDLKPANVKLKPDGTVKVLDFGISKPIDPKAISGSPAMTTPAMTQTGVILGTAAYMSPEQARGLFVDQRTDIWAFGCLLFEMLTGQPAFGGEDLMATLARVIDRDTDLNSVPQTISPAVRHTIKLCLEKSSKRRISDIRDVRLALEGRFESELPRAGRADSAQPGWRRLLPLAAALALGGVIVGAAAWMLASDGASLPVTRFSEPVEPVSNLPALAISDDGAQIAYIEGVPSRTMIRRLDEFAPRPLLEATVGSVGGSPVTGMCFSPDGEWLAYPVATADELRKTPLTGGRGLTLAEGQIQAIGGCDWADDGYIYFGSQQGIARVSESGGEVELLTSVEGSERLDVNPQILPGGAVLSFTAIRGDVLGDMSVGILDLETRETTLILPSAGLAVFAPTGPKPGNGYFVYGQDAALFAAPFDVDRREAGPVRPIIDEIFGIAGISFVAISRTGTLAYMDGELIGTEGSTLSWVDRAGTVRAATETPAIWGEVALSPDGKRAAGGMVDLGDEIKADVWTVSFDGGRMARTTFSGFNGSIVWTPDGGRLLYAGFDSVAQFPGTLESVPTDNSGAPMTIADFGNIAAYPTSISPDGSVLLGTTAGAVTLSGSDIWALTLDDDAPARAEPVTEADLEFVLQSAFNESHATFSPDGRWIAYVSNETGTEQVYVVPYPGPGGKFQVSTDGGRQPRWNPAGNEIFYLNGPRMMVVDVETESRFDAGTPRALFENAALVATGPANAPAFQYAVAPDGQQFLMLSSGGDSGAGQWQLRVVRNWFEELQRLVPTE
jgi:Tol biopolymer transport system component